MEVNSPNFCHGLLVRSKEQVLLQGKEIIQGVNTIMQGAWGHLEVSP